MHEPTIIGPDVERAVRAAAVAVPAPRPDVAGVLARARHRRRRAAGAVVAAVAVIGVGGAAALRTVDPGGSPVAVTAPADAPAGPLADLAVEDGVRVVEVTADGTRVDRWRAPAGWLVYGDRPVPLAGGRFGVLVARDDPTVPAGFEVALHLVDGDRSSVHAVPVGGDHVALLDVAGTEAILLRRPNGVAGDARIVARSLDTGRERPVTEGLDQDGATAAGGGTVVHVRPWTCTVEADAVDAVDAGLASSAWPGGCPDGWTASVATPVVSPDGRLAAVAWELRDGPGPVEEGPPPAGAVLVTVVDLVDGTVRWSSPAADPEGLAVRRLAWLDVATLRLAAEGPVAGALQATGDGVTVEVVPPGP